MPRRAFSNAVPGNGIVLSADNGGLTGVIRSWQFSNTITEADPGAGYWRFNHADPESGSFIYVSATDGQAKDMTGLLSAFGVGTKLQIRSANAPGQFLIITITSNDDNSAAGWSTLGYTVVSGAPNFIDDETLVVEVGFVGAQGLQGEGVPAGGTSGQVLSKSSGTDFDTEWTTGGNVTSSGSIGDNRLIKGDGGAKGIQETGISVDDSDIMYVPGGIRLGADASNNQLDDYETGTFTLTIGTILAGNYAAATGISQVYARYTLVGKVCFIRASFTITGLSATDLAPGDVLHIRGLPFTVANLTGSADQFAAGAVYRSLGSALNTLLGGYVSSSDHLYLFAFALASNNAKNTDEHFINFSYEIA